MNEDFLEELAQVLATLNLYHPGLSYQETAKRLLDQLNFAGLQVIA